MITKGFLMFWGGIAGLSVTLLFTIVLLVVSAKKKKIVVDLLEHEEIMQTERLEETIISKKSSINPRTITVVDETKVLSQNIKKTLPDTQLMDIK